MIANSGCGAARLQVRHRVSYIDVYYRKYGCSEQKHLEKQEAHARNPPILHFHSKQTITVTAVFHSFPKTHLSHSWTFEHYWNNPGNFAVDLRFSAVIGPHSSCHFAPVLTVLHSNTSILPGTSVLMLRRPQCTFEHDLHLCPHRTIPVYRSVRLVCWLTSRSYLQGDFAVEYFFVHHFLFGGISKHRFDKTLLFTNSCHFFQRDDERCGGRGTQSIITTWNPLFSRTFVRFNWKSYHNKLGDIAKVVNILR